jgi:predicted  nucleic acid-binding Zn-ribbon protein
VVTPRVEASPDRSDFAKLGETIAASLVQAQEHANHASVLLEQTKQFAEDIRSQVAEKSRELAEMNERLMAFGDSLLAADRKFLGSEVQQHQIARLECPGLGG